MGEGQRATPPSAASASRSSAEASRGSWPAQFVVEDGAAVAGDQASKSAFLASLRGPLRQMVDQELAGTAWSSRDCPWIDHYLDSFSQRPVHAFHRQVRHHIVAPIPESTDELRRRIVARARQGLHEWRISGRPPRLLTDMPAGPGREVSGPLEAVLSIFRKAEPGAGPAPGTSRAVLGLAPGHGLEGPARSRMESAFGTSLAHVRLHTDASGAALAREQNAQAVAVGPHVAFAPGRFAPGTARGDALLAHELAHTLQQRSGARGGDTAGLEAEADRAAASVLFGGDGRVAGQSGLRLQRCSGPDRDVPDAVTPDQIPDDPDVTAPPTIDELPVYEAPERTPSTPNVAMQIGGDDAAARAAAVEALRSRPAERRSWVLVLLATGSTHEDTRGAATALVTTWLTDNPPFVAFVDGLARAPDGELGDLAIAALMRAGRSDSVDLDNYRRVIQGRIEIARRLQSKLRQMMLGLAVPAVTDELFQGTELDALAVEAASADASALTGVGVRASRLTQRFGLVHRELAVMADNLEGTEADSELATALRGHMLEILGHAGRITSAQDDAAFANLIAVIERAPAAYVTVMLDGVHGALVEGRDQLDQLIESVPEDSRSAAAVQRRTVDPVRTQLVRAIELLDGARAGVEADPASVYEYLQQVGASMVSLQERVMYSALALDASIRAYAAMLPSPTRDGIPFDIFEPAEQGEILDTWLNYSETFETLASERDRNPEEVRRIFDEVMQAREGESARFETWNASHTAQWELAMQEIHFQADALMVLTALTPARWAGTGARAFAGWLLGRFATGLAGRLVIGASALGVEATVFHFTHEGLRTLFYGEEFWDENFNTNWMMSVALFGTMGVSSRAYRAVTTNAVEAGTLSATRAAAGSLALEFGVLQSFGVIAQRIHTGEWVLPNNPQFWQLAIHNLAMMGALHLGGHATRPLNEAVGGRILQPFVRSFNTRAQALDARIAEFVRDPARSPNEAAQIIRHCKTLNAERLHLARMMRETTPETFSAEDLAYVRDFVGTLGRLADASLFDASINLRPHETAPDVFYFDGPFAEIRAAYEGRGYEVVEAAPETGRLRLRGPEGQQVIELLQVGTEARSLPTDFTLDPVTRSELVSELVRLGEPRDATEALSDGALVARHHEIQQGGLRGRVYELAEEAVLDEAARLEMLQELGEDYFSGDAPFARVRFGAGRPELSRLTVPLEAGGELTVFVTVRLVQVAAGGGSHGRLSGPARVTLRRSESGQWTADVEIDPRLSRADAEIALRHEIGEAARIVRALGSERALSQDDLRARIDHLQSASLMREGATSLELTAHDIEAVHELGRLFEAYRRDGTDSQQGQVTAQLRTMGFAERQYGRVHRLSAVAEHLEPTLAGDLSVFINTWVGANASNVPVAGPRTVRYAEILEYTDALAGLRGATSDAARQPHQATMARIEALARASNRVDRLTRDLLLEEGYPEADIARVLRLAGARNPCKNLYPEIETLLSVRDTITTTPFAERISIVAVDALTAGGPVEGATFETLFARLEQAHADGRLASLTPTADPVGGTMTLHLRLTWEFADGSKFSIDLPGVGTPSSYGINHRMHGAFEAANSSDHLTESGITVPATSMPAHLLIYLDTGFQNRMLDWNIVYDHGRHPVER